MIEILTVSMIHSMMEYAAVVWLPRKKNVRKIGRIQTAATKMVPSLRDILPFEERLSRFNLPILEERMEQ